MFNIVPSLQSMSAQSLYARVEDTIALAELNAPRNQVRPNTRNDSRLPIPAEGVMPSSLFNSSRKLALLNRLPAAIRQELEKVGDWEGFLFHPSARQLAEKGQCAVACYLSMERALTEIGKVNPREEREVFAPSIICGVDSRGGIYLRPINSHCGIVRLEAGQPPAPGPHVSEYPTQEPIRLLPSRSNNLITQAPLTLRGQSELLTNPGRDRLWVKNPDGTFEPVVIRGRDGKNSNRYCPSASGISGNGRFVVMTFVDDILVHDRDLNETKYLDGLNRADFNFAPTGLVQRGPAVSVKVSVSNDGTAYIGGQTRGHIVPIDDRKDTVYVSYGDGRADMRGLRQPFGVTPDGGYLVRPIPGEMVSNFCLRNLGGNHQEINVRRIVPSGSPDSDYLTCIAFSPLNTIVAAGYADGAVGIFDLTNTVGDNAKLLIHTVRPDGSDYAWPVISFSNSFDEIRVAYVNSNGGVLLTTLKLGTATAQLPIQETSRVAIQSPEDQTTDTLQTVANATESEADQPAVERGQAQAGAVGDPMPLQPFPLPVAYGLPGSALQALQHLAQASSRDSAAVATELMRRWDSGHIGVWLAGLMNPYPRAAAAPLKAYLELVNALHASGHLTSEQTQSLLLPESKRERHLPISAAVASHWQSGVARPFVSTLANSMPENGEEQVTSRLSLAQSDQHHPQLKMRHSANFYKQIKRGMENLSAGQQDTPALRLLAEHGLIPPQRELGRMVKKLPAAAPTAASPIPTPSEILTHINDVMPAVLRQVAQKQKQDAELEKARVTYQANRQAAEHAQKASKSSPVAAMVAGLSIQLHAQGAVLRAQKQQHIAQWEQAQATRRHLEDGQYQQKRDRALPGGLATLMRADLVAVPARASAGKETEYALSKARQRAGQHEEQQRDAQRAIGSQVEQDAADAATNLQRIEAEEIASSQAREEELRTLEILSRAPSTSNLRDPAPARARGQRVAEYIDESGRPRTQAW